MIPILYFFIVLILLLFVVAVAWRYASRRHTIPCPVWMSGLLIPLLAWHECKYEKNPPAS
jgi:hypothetical protein